MHLLLLASCYGRKGAMVANVGPFQCQNQPNWFDTLGQEGIAVTELFVPNQSGCQRELV